MAARLRHACSNRAIADSSRMRAAAGVSGPLCGSNGLLVFAFGKPFVLRTRLKRRVRARKRIGPGSFGNCEGRPSTTFADSSSARATCSVTCDGDHLPGARGVRQCSPQPSAAAIIRTTASRLAARLSSKSLIRPLRLESARCVTRVRALNESESLSIPPKKGFRLYAGRVSHRYVIEMLSIHSPRCRSRYPTNDCRSCHSDSTTLVRTSATRPPPGTLSNLIQPGYFT